MVQKFQIFTNRNQRRVEMFRQVAHQNASLALHEFENLTPPFFIQHGFKSLLSFFCSGTQSETIERHAASRNISTRTCFLKSSISLISAAPGESARQFAAPQATASRSVSSIPNP